MNPVGLLTFYLLRMVSIGDVGDKFFVNRRLRRCIVYGPGVLALGNNINIRNSHFYGCDFFEVEAGHSLYAALLMDGLDADHVRFHKVTIVTTSEGIEKFRKSATETSEELNVVPVLGGLPT